MKQIKIIALVLFIGFISTAFSQKGNTERKNKRIAILTKVITKALDLTAEESKVFWPIYKQRIADKKEKRKPFKGAKRKDRKKLEVMTDDEVLKLMDNMLVIRQIELDIEKEYKAKFLKILPPKKVAKLYHIEKRLKQKRKNKMDKKRKIKK